MRRSLPRPLRVRLLPGVPVVNRLEPPRNDPPPQEPGHVPLPELVLPNETDTPELRLAYGGSLNLLAQVVGLVASFLVGVFVARLLGPAGRGQLAVLMQVSALLVILLGLGISGAHTYFISNGKTSAGTAVGNSLALSAMATVVGIPLAMLFLVGPWAILPNLPFAAAACAALAVPLGLLAGWLMGVSSGLGKLRLNLRYAFLSSTVTLLGLALLVASGSDSLTAVVGISVTGTAVGSIVLLTGMGGRARPVRVDLRSARAMVAYSAKTYAAGLAGYLNLRQDVVLLGWLAGASAVGLYSVGVSFAELIWYVPAALGGVIFARGAGRSSEATLDYVSRSSRVSVLVMLALAAIGILLVPPMIRIVFGRDFAPAYWVFLALIPGVVGDGVARVVMSFQMSTGRVYWRESVFSTVLNLAANLALIPAFGFVGAAVASSVSYLVLAALLFRRLRLDTGASARSFLVPTFDDVRAVGDGIAGLPTAVTRRRR